MRASFAILLVSPVALTGCPALLSDWTISGSGAADASAGPDATGGGSGGTSSSSVGGTSATTGGVGGTRSSTGGVSGTTQADAATCNPSACPRCCVGQTSCCTSDDRCGCPSCFFLGSVCTPNSGMGGTSGTGGSSGGSSGSTGGTAGAICESLQGPTALDLTNAGAIGITFHSKVNATLVKFVFHNGGYADTVSLEDAVSCSVIASIPTPANVQSYTANVSLQLVANKSYRLVSSKVGQYNETQAVTAPGG